MTGSLTVRDVPLAEVAEYIDWSPFFWTWELKGSYPSIFDNPTVGAQAKELFAEAHKLLERVIKEKRFWLEGVIGIFPAHAEGDDVIVHDPERPSRELQRFCFLRQQRDREGLPNLCLSDFIAPKDTGVTDYMGGFAVVCHGVEAFAKEFEDAHDDYSSIMVKALGDRFAEALAEYLHKRAREAWGYGKAEKLSPEALIREEYRGIRPAPGYPACPDHTEKAKLWSLLNVEQRLGMRLTESFAMWPGSSVSGLYFGHPQSAYFGVGNLGKDQIEDYAVRKSMPVAEIERWLGPWLGYNPGN